MASYHYRTAQNNVVVEPSTDTAETSDTVYEQPHPANPTLDVGTAESADARHCAEGYTAIIWEFSEFCSTPKRWQVYREGNDS